jgi:hypothetical protein
MTAPKLTTAKSIGSRWSDWIESDDGKRCADVTTLPHTDSSYLENRLWRAFHAGMEAGRLAKAGKP